MRMAHAVIIRQHFLTVFNPFICPSSSLLRSNRKRKDADVRNVVAGSRCMLQHESTRLIKRRREEKGERKREEQCIRKEKGDAYEGENRKK